MSNYEMTCQLLDQVLILSARIEAHSFSEGVSLCQYGSASEERITQRIFCDDLYKDLYSVIQTIKSNFLGGLNNES